MQKKLLVFVCLLSAFLIVNSTFQILPVFATSTFGKDTDGTSTASFGWNRKVGSKYTCLEAGTLTKITARIYTDSAITVYTDIYSDVAGVPTTLLGISNGVTSPTSVAWTDFPFSTTVLLTANTAYWLVFNFGSAAGSIRQADGDTNQGAYNVDVPPAENPFGTPTYMSKALSIYATYTPTPTAESRSFTLPETLSLSDDLVQRQEQKQVLTEVFSHSDGITMTQEQKYVLSETVTTTTVLTHGAEIPVNLIEIFNSEILHITDTIRIWQEHKYIFPSTITFNESPIFQNFVLEIYTYINEVLAIAAIAFILAVTALALVLVYQRQKD